MSKNKSFKPTSIPHRAKNGEPMAYYTLSADGKIHTEVSRSVCLARNDEPTNPFPQRWYDGVLVFAFKDGSEQTVTWENRSRRESWTDEMKQAARERALGGADNG